MSRRRQQKKRRKNRNRRKSRRQGENRSSFQSEHQPEFGSIPSQAELLSQAEAQAVAEVGGRPQSIDQIGADAEAKGPARFEAFEQERSEPKNRPLIPKTSLYQEHFRFLGSEVLEKEYTVKVKFFQLPEQFPSHFSSENRQIKLPWTLIKSIQFATPNGSHLIFEGPGLELHMQTINADTIIYQMQKKAYPTLYWQDDFTMNINARSNETTQLIMRNDEAEPQMYDGWWNAKAHTR